MSAKVYFCTAIRQERRRNFGRAAKVEVDVELHSEGDFVIGHWVDFCMRENLPPFRRTALPSPHPGAALLLLHDINQALVLWS